MTNNTDSLPGFSETMTRAIAFIWREAELLDRKNYAEWSALWSDEGMYVVPINPDPDETDFESQLNYVYDNPRMRKLRIDRLTSGFAVSAVDASNTLRTVSRFSQVSDIDSVIEVNSAQMLVGYKRGTHTIFAANLTHRIHFGEHGPKLEQKVIRLINSTDSLNALGFLL